MRNARFLLTVPAACAALFAAPAYAGTATTTFQVTATVASNCGISATTLGFGTYHTDVQLDGTSTVTVTCTSGLAYNVGLDKGINGADVTHRAMNSGVNTLSYSLFSDSSRTVNWGNTVGTDTVSGTGNGSAQPLTVYGRIPAVQPTYVPAGSYADTITATVSF